MSDAFRKLRLVGAIVVILLAAGACGNSGGDDSSGGSPTTGRAASGGASDVPGVTKDEIHFSVFGTRSNNPTGSCVLDCYTDGINAYFAFRNDEGGAFGRDLKLTTELDDELSKNQEVALQITSANDTFAAFSATQLPTGWHEITDAGMPLYVWGIHNTEMNGNDSLFANTGVICTTCSQRFFVYPGTLVDATKVGTLGYGVSQASEDCVASQNTSIERYADETGQEVAYTNDDLAFGLPNGIGPEVTAMKQKDVDFVTACFDLNGMKTLAQEMERQGMGDVPMLHPNSYDANFVKEAGDPFEGDIVQVGFRPFEADPDDSGMDDYLKWMDETGSDLTETAMVGWINADLAYQGILAAGEDFDRQSVIEATNEMTSYTADGLINPIDWSRQHDAPEADDPEANGYKQECAVGVQVEGGEFTLIGEKDKPFWCWPDSGTEWSDPEPTNVEGEG